MHGKREGEGGKRKRNGKAICIIEWLSCFLLMLIKDTNVTPAYHPFQEYHPLFTLLLLLLLLFVSPIHNFHTSSPDHHLHYLPQHPFTHPTSQPRRYHQIMNRPKGEQEQKFRMGEQTIKIEPQWDGKIHYHRMNEILDAFPTAVGFEIDGDALDFLTKDNGDLYVFLVFGLLC